MENHHDYLQREADYQDLKITSNPRDHLTKCYCDDSSKYRAQRRREYLGSLAGKRVLDLGCGDGFASIDALRAGACVTAIDISPKSIEYLLTWAKKARLEHRLDALVMDAHHLEFEDGSFDIVFGNGILHHLPNLELAIREVRRVLKPGGYAVFLEPLGMNPLLNLFRKTTPECRTSDEQPFRMKELNLIKAYFPDSRFAFFDCATLLAKLPLLLGFTDFAESLQTRLIEVDKKLLGGETPGNVSFLQKMSWTVLIKLTKEE